MGIICKILKRNSSDIGTTSPSHSLTVITTITWLWLDTELIKMGSDSEGEADGIPVQSVPQHDVISTIRDRVHATTQEIRKYVVHNEILTRFAFSSRQSVLRHFWLSYTSLR